ncbi:MAG: right-handed parallel beta-helix repeat-containing protein [Kiritimatiellae bacterium]|nr:right-handed parallel beta-helix repeat-containing protein [Kiritimatiellia bacterium]
MRTGWSARGWWIAAVLLVAAVRNGEGGTAWDFVVAPDGDDRGPGTAQRPFATIGRAQAAVRELWASSTNRAEVRVGLRGGVWTLEEPIVFRPEDSPPPHGRTIYAAWPGETPVLAGGVRLKGFQPTPTGAWQLRVPASVGASVEHLYVNGRRAVRARHPNAGNAFLLADAEETPPATNRSRSGHSTVRLRFAPAELAPLVQLSSAALARVHVVVHHKWDHTRRWVQGLDAAAGAVITTGRPTKVWNPITKGCLAYFENVPTACDAPGEWSVEANGTLCYRPRAGETPENAEVWAARTGTLLRFEGDPAAGRWVERIRIEGLHLLYADYRTPDSGFEPHQAAANIEAAVMADGAREVELIGLTLRHTGAHGVWFRRGCQRCRIERCELSDLGGGGVKVGDHISPRSPAEETWGNVIHNNIIHHGGRHFPCACGIWIGHSGTNTVTHNDVGDFFYTGISVGWVWGYGRSFARANDIGYNHVHHIGQGWLSDMGGIYTLGRSEGTRVHHNHFHHIWAHTYGGWGLYTDEGSTGILFEKNLVHDTKDGSFHQHYGRGNVVRNNILAFSRYAQIRVTRIDDRNPPPAGVNVPDTRLTLERNIILWDTGAPLDPPERWGRLAWTSASNLWWCVAGPVTNLAGRTLAQWMAVGREVGSIVADPKFRNAAARDFALAPDSPAFALGFEPFDPSRAGVCGDAAWIERARRAPMPDPRNLPAWSK